MTKNTERSDAADRSTEAGTLITRRRVMRGTALTASLGALTGVGLWYGSQPTLAVTDADSWVAQSAEITTQDGSVDSITFGDPNEETDSGELGEGDDGLVVEWGGFDASPTTIDFGITIAGTDGGDGGDWAGGDTTTEPEELTTGQGEVEGSNGSETFTWIDIFGTAQPVNVENHTEIDLSDFEAEEDNSTTVRELEVGVEAEAPSE